MKSRHCVAGDHVVYGERAIEDGEFADDGFVCGECRGWHEADQPPGPSRRPPNGMISMNALKRRMTKLRREFDLLDAELTEETRQAHSLKQSDDPDGADS